jgi:hypothetical protein
MLVLFENKQLCLMSTLNEDVKSKFIVMVISSIFRYFLFGKLYITKLCDFDVIKLMTN